MSERTNTKLTTKQKLFAEAYLATPNGTDAARKAGYKGNDNTLASVAKENLRKPQISDLIQNRIESIGMSANEIIIELSVIAKTELSATEHIKATDKIKALELLGKRFAMWTENHKHEGDIRIEVVYTNE
jgi:phage terminase small subunit